MMIKRIKNPYFWIGFIGLFLTATRIDPTTLTSWQALGQALYGFISNPFLIGAFIAASVGQYIDPTTAGFKDVTTATTTSSPNATTIQQ